MDRKTTSTRAGRYIKQLNGYPAFVPNPLPPSPPINMDGEMMRLLSAADLALGRLDGVTTILPNPDLFVAMYVKQEAVFSSQIEGTQSTLEDVLDYEADAARDTLPRDTPEVVNYVRAMNQGLKRLDELPLSLRLIREIHAILLEGVRGGEKTPGEFRKTQNWIGPSECSLHDAEFIPPSPHDMNNSLGDFEKFLHDRSSLPALIHCGLAHAQFETIHPFLDGNGRMGRLLITFVLCERGILSKPLLYLSYFLKQNKSEYYQILMNVRRLGDWEGWLKFFLRGISEVSQTATETAKKILLLREDHRLAIMNMGASRANGLILLDHLYQMPVISINSAKETLNVNYTTTSTVIKKLEKIGILKEITGQRRNRWFRYEDYISLFRYQAISMADETLKLDQETKDQ